jgi:hypothetical protein
MSDLFLIIWATSPFWVAILAMGIAIVVGDGL